MYNNKQISNMNKEEVEVALKEVTRIFQMPEVNSPEYKRYAGQIAMLEKRHHAIIRHEEQVQDYRFLAK